MSTITKSFTFVAGATAVAEALYENFQELADFCNVNVPTSDAGKAYTGVPSLPASSPTAHGQAVRKTNVDEHAALKYVGAPIRGGSSPDALAVGGYIIKAARAQGTTSGGGSLVVPFGTPFPSGIITIVPTLDSGTGAVADCPITAYGLSSFTWVISGLNNTFVRISYVAIGY